jgi:DNA-binding transcriptional regulator YiaG
MVDSNPDRNRTFASSPTPEQIKQARVASGLTQADAGELIYCSMRLWQQWESGESIMHPALYELFMIKAGLVDSIEK